jgi:hypothetical protein
VTLDFRSVAPSRAKGARVSPDRGPEQFLEKRCVGRERRGCPAWAIGSSKRRLNGDVAERLGVKVLLANALLAVG